MYLFKCDGNPLAERESIGIYKSERLYFKPAMGILILPHTLTVFTVATLNDFLRCLRGLSFTLFYRREGELEKTHFNNCFGCFTSPR